MKKMRILKNEWPSFVKNFNRQNQFRRASLTLGENVVVGEPGLPLVGLAYDPEKRRVDIYLGGTDTENLAHLSHGVEVPRALYLITDEEASNPVVGMQIQGPPGTSMAYVMFEDEMPENVRCHWIANVAYTLFEIRGGKVHGHDQKDWYEAERLIKETIVPFLV
ncbi:MAG: hypothetical protein DRP37_08425 [Thermodesulfobacteriota bacterium]|nr:MAG: hypothetical protein DRP37_08425 [Thermodesulfobacteriota bacterium]